jgi:hypothetical protein
MYISSFNRPARSHYLFHIRMMYISAKISCSHFYWYKSCIHLNSLNVRHSGVAKAIG